METASKQNSGKFQVKECSDQEAKDKSQDKHKENQIVSMLFLDKLWAVFGRIGQHDKSLLRKP